MNSIAQNLRAARRDDSTITRWVGFRVDEQNYALDIHQVQEVLAAAEIEPVPGAPSAVLGVINLRGRIVTVVDLRRCLGFAAAGDTGPCSVIIVDVGGESLGMRVDGIAEICSVAEAAIKPAPAIHGREPDPLVHGIVSRPGLMMTLLDAERLAQIAAA
ncbi:MAG: chemotaxis protein CheW [Nevskia sp.]|nr:chemotaxis protein CheW [Nevskia sp.]